MCGIHEVPQNGPSAKPLVLPHAAKERTKEHLKHSRVHWVGSAGRKEKERRPHGDGSWAHCAIGPQLVSGSSQAHAWGAPQQSHGSGPPSHLLSPENTESPPVSMNLQFCFSLFLQGLIDKNCLYVPHSGDVFIYICCDMVITVQLLSIFTFGAGVRIFKIYHLSQCQVHNTAPLAIATLLDIRSQGLFICS